MDPVGLAVGVVGLAGLFSTCLEAVQKFDSYKDFDRDSRSLATQFDADKHRFEEWGRAVGFENGRLSDSHHPALDDAEKLAVVRKLLSSIQDFCSSADDALCQQYMQPDNGFAKGGSISARQTQPRYSAPEASRWRKAAWAFREKVKQTSHVQTFATLVQYLYDVVPPNDASGALSKYRIGNDGLTQSQDSLTAFLDEIRAFMNKAEEEMQAEIKRDLRVWLGCPSANDLYDDSIQKRLDGTCEWILERDEIRDWLSSSVPTTTTTNNVLWINGPAGFGKTILCARLVEILSANLQTPVAHFFLSAKFEGRDNPFMALRSWVADVTFGNPAALDVVYKRRLAQYEQVATRATLVRLFCEVVQTVPFCTFVLDGLDECTRLGESRDDTNSVARFLSELKQAVAGTTARIMVISRNEPEIRHGLSQFPGFTEYRISPEDVHVDNIAFSRSIVDNKLFNKDDSTRSSISQKMAIRCNGQFQWLKMQEELLRQSRNRRQLEKAIDAAPAGLDSLYDRNWERIERLRHEERTRAFSLLRWAAFSVRPLTVFEITGAVLVDEDCDDLPVEEFPDSIDDEYVKEEILHHCGSLIEVQGDLFPAGLRKVHLAHFSVKEYLLCKISSRGTVLLANEKLRALNQSIERTALAKLCLQYIMFPSVWNNSLAEEKDQIRVSFRDYAAEFWYQHTDLDETKDDALMETMNAFFNRRDQTWELWRQWFDSNRNDVAPEETEATMPASPLYYASVLGLTGVLKHLIQHCNHDPNEKSNSGRSVLVNECQKGNMEIAQMLLGAGADVDGAGHSGQTALIAASMNGHLDVVKLLLNYKATITIGDEDGWTPLIAASFSGRLEVVKLLLDNGADVSDVDGNGRTPLIAASFSGRLEVVKLLLDNGADVSDVDGNGWTSLDSASLNNHSEVVDLLINKGANVSFADKDGCTPLHVGAAEGHLEVIKLLLGNGASITLTLEDGSTPLYLAAANGHFEAVHLLLSNGADVTVARKGGWTPLHAVAAEGHLEVIKLLLSNGASTTLTLEDRSTPLYLAAANGHFEAVELLLSHGADVTVTNNQGWTPLNRAADNGHLEVAKLLLAEGADLTVTNNGGWTPLNNAADNGHLEVVKLLLAEGADVTVTNNGGWTPLNNAADNGHLEVAKLLLAHRAEVTVTNNDGWAPLHAASFKGYLEMAKLLLAHGADVTVTDNHGRTPLHAAALKCHVEVAEIFLKRYPDHIELKDKLGRTSLFLAAARGRTEMVRFLLSQKASAHVQDFYNATPLIAASRHGHESVVELLLQGPNICLEHKDDFGLTALSWASKSGNAHTLQLLLENSDKEDVQINGEDALTRKEAISFHEDWAYCDVCTICIPDGKALHLCDVCSGGDDFCICSECYAAGMKCLDGSHKWSLQEGE